MHQEIIEKMLQDKLNAAKQEGITEGRQLALIEIAKALFVEGTPVEKIAHLTGLSETEIKELIRDK